MKAILTGVYICLIIQILIVGIINLFQKGKRNKILGAFCFLLIFSLIKRAFWENIESTGLYCIFGGPHEILYAPLLYTYLLVSGTKTLQSKTYNHVFLAFSVYLILHLLAVFFFRDSHHYIAPFFLFSIIVFSIYYFIKSLSLYKHQLKNTLKSYPKYRFRFFYLSTNLYILLKAFVISFAFLNAVFKSEVLNIIYINFSLPAFYYVVVPLFIILCLTYIFYGLTEINSLKKTILNIDIHKKSRNSKVGYQDIWMTLEHSSIYTNPNINFNDFVEKTGVNSVVISQFLKDNGFHNFQDLINRYRISYFKSRVKDTMFKKYDLVGIAKECGFKSKATFYRVFKKYEHMTPGEYFENVP